MPSQGVSNHHIRACKIPELELIGSPGFTGSEIVANVREMQEDCYRVDKEDGSDLLARHWVLQQVCTDNGAI